MDLVNRVDYSSMVPDKIFLHIFRNLPSEDRKSIRSTCRRFYELCNDSHMQMSEVFAFYGVLNTVAALHCLSRSSRKIENIKFSHVPLNVEVVLPFFEQHGPHVRSLEFQNCSFDPGAMKTVIERCVSLRHFALEFSLSVDYDNVLSDFGELVTNSIVRSCVTDFSLIMLPSYYHFSNRKLRHFFAVFPGITKLNLDIRPTSWSWILDARSELCAVSSDMFTDWSFTFSSIYDRLLALADQLEVLKLNFECVPPNNLLDIRMKNLKQLSVSWFYDLPDIPSLYHSSLFEGLTHFDCSIYPDRETEWPYLVVQRLLQFAPLQSLTITNCDVMDRELFTALVESKLRILTMRRVGYRVHSLPRPEFGNTEPWSFENPLMPNYCLQQLIMEECDRDWTSLFAPYFLSLNHLTFFQVHEGVLRNILKDQTNVRSLHLRNRSFYTGEKDFKTLSYFQDWLRFEKTIDFEFKYLTVLRIYEQKYCLTNFLLSEFSFPKLKSLSIAIRDLDERDDEDHLCHLISKLPQLESLILVLSSQMSFSLWLSLCEELPTLRHLHVVDNSAFFTRAEYVRLFEVSPSLRTLVHYSRPFKSCGAEYLFYDVMKKTVVEVEEQASSDLSDEICKFIPLMTFSKRKYVSEERMYNEREYRISLVMANLILPYVVPHMPSLYHMGYDYEEEKYIFD